MSGHEQRIVVLAPTRKDAELVETVFTNAGLASIACPTVARACEELDAGGAALLLAEELVAQEELPLLTDWLSRQPPWSDLPILLLARHGADSPLITRAMESLGNITILERPTRIATLVSVARAAMRSRARQYQIREHLAERERTETALRENDRRKDEFLAILGHELRNPLAPVRNSLQILRLTGISDPNSVRLVDVMERQVNHLVRLVDDLLEVSRITRGKIELRRESIEIATIIRNAVETSRPLIDAAGHQLAIAIPSEPLTLDADPVRLQQVFGNLLNNAAKYTNPGGQIWLSVCRDGSDVAVSVRDTGAGIPPELLPRIFDLFMQVDQHPDRAQGGLGIGLTLVKRLVEMHGGQIEARSEGLGHGSEFIVRLPLAASPPAGESALSNSPRAEFFPRRRILVVDDNHDAADSLSALLRLLGAEVRVAYSGQQALEVLATYRPAAVLLDLGMPGLDGLEVARWIRRQPAFRDVTLIALSGLGQAGDVSRSEAAGFDHHLVKPADVAVLENLLAPKLRD